MAITYVDKATGETVSGTWNNISEANQNRILGGVGLVSAIIPVKGITKLGKIKTTGAINSAGLKLANIEIPGGLAQQADDVLSIAARKNVKQGAVLYRIGTLGKSATSEAQFWSLENPLTTPNFAQKYGIPAENIINADFIETATIKSGINFITRPAPRVGSNLGGGIEIVVPENGVVLKSFNTGKIND